jgi:PIN like domain
VIGAAPGLFVDENVIGLGRALAEARDDVLHPGHPDIPEVPLQTLDPDWIPVVAGRGLVVLGRDKRIRYKRGEQNLWLTGGLRVVALTGTKDMNTWDMLGLVVRHWGRLERFIDVHGGGPWWGSWTNAGIERRA